MSASDERRRRLRARIQERRKHQGHVQAEIREDRKAATGPAENKALAGPPENKVTEAVAETQATPAVTFASQAAADRAEEYGLGPEAFADTEPSGKTGYTVADVEAVAEG